MRPKPTAADLGVDLESLPWRRSGEGGGAFEVAFVTGDGDAEGRVDWILLRVSGDPDDRVLVYDRIEWECFLDGVNRGEFDNGT